MMCGNTSHSGEFAPVSLSAKTEPRLSISPGDVTLDAPSDASLNGSQEVCRLHLRDGNSTAVRSEVAHLLRSRLRSASLIIFAGLALFLVWHIVSLDRVDRAIFVVNFIAHIAATFVIG